jgi:hypothetical protein
MAGLQTKITGEKISYQTLAIISRMDLQEALSSPLITWKSLLASESSYAALEAE